MSAVGRLELEALPGRFAVCRQPPDAAFPAAMAGGALFAAVRTDQELSIVCDVERAPAGCPREGPFAALRVCGTLDFALVGILAGLTRALAEAEISVFALSTYDTDILLVREDALGSAVAALRGAGFAVST